MGAKYVCRHLASCYGLTLEESLVQRILAHSERESTGSKSRDWQRLRSIWSGMMRRCTDPKHARYKDYGGGGITVCKSWQEFWTFHKWSIVSGYKDGLTLDRLDNKRGYEPDNCRWVVAHVQSSNRRNVCTPGVHRLRDGEYVASLTICGKQVFYERYKSQEEAVAARREAERTYLGYSITGK